MKLFDEDGVSVSPDEVVQKHGLVIKCFMCEEQLKAKGGILFSPPEEEYSDNVNTVKDYHMCVKCFPVVLGFMSGRVKNVDVPAKLGIIEHHVIEGDMRKTLCLLNELRLALLGRQKNDKMSSM